MKHVILFHTILLFLTACGSKPAEKKELALPADSTEVIKLTQAQYEAAHITLGTVTTMPMGSTIQVNGRLDVPPQNMVTISAPMGGFVKSTSLLQGMKVRKGDVLATLENQEYIQLQQDYLDNKSKLQFLAAEYDRQKELSRENVNAVKTLEQSKSQYESSNATVLGLEAKLSMINIPLASLTGGKIKSTINLYAPINGFVSRVNVNVGQFVNATDAMFKIVDVDHIHAELQVYEKDISKIAIGQKLTFQLANVTAKYNASVFLIGKEISIDRTVSVHCHLDKENAAFLPGMFVTATIQTTSNEAEVLANSAIVNFQGQNFIFIVTGDRQFRAVPVILGNSANEFTELQLDKNFDRKSAVALTGVAELIGLLKNKQE